MDSATVESESNAVSETTFFSNNVLHLISILCSKSVKACKLFIFVSCFRSQATPCRCNNTCSRKTMAKTTGCPCKTAKVHCTDLCTCGPKKKSCKNKAVKLATVALFSG